MTHCLCSCIHGLEPADAACVHACMARLYVYMGLFMRMHICSKVHTHAVSSLHTQTLTRVHVSPSKNPNFTIVSFVSHPNANLTTSFHLFVGFPLIFKQG